MPWCKLHTDILGDAKLLRAARKGARSLVVLPWLFAWAKAHDPENLGRLLLDGEPVEPEDVAAQLPGVKAAEVAACLAGAESVGILERDPDAPDVLRFAAWPTRSGEQSQKPSDHPEAVLARVHRHRMKKRGSTQVDVAPSLTNTDPAPVAEETRVQRDVTPDCNALYRVTGVSSVTQSKREKEKEKKNPTAADAASADDDDPPGFDLAFTTLPERDGGNPRKRAARAYAARLREGATPEEIHAGAVRYAAWIDARGKRGTEHVMQAATFFGPDKQYRQPWAIVAAPSERRAGPRPVPPGDYAPDALRARFARHDLDRTTDRDSYVRRVEEARPADADPDTWRTLVMKHLKPWDLGALTFGPEVERKIVQRLADAEQAGAWRPHRNGQYLAGAAA